MTRQIELDQSSLLGPKNAPHEIDGVILVPAPKLCRALNISAVTLWRWRHNAVMNFPIAKTINGRNYFAWPEIRVWLDAQRPQ